MYLLKFDLMVQIPVSEMPNASSSSSSAAAAAATTKPIPIRRVDLSKLPLPPSWAHQREAVQVVDVATGTADYALVEATLTRRGAFSAGEVSSLRLCMFSFV